MYEHFTVPKTYTSESLKQEYEKATDGKKAAECKLAQLELNLKRMHTELLKLIQFAQQNLDHSDEIALRKYPFREDEYIDLLIESEKQEASPGWQGQVQYLKSTREHAALVKIIKNSIILYRNTKRAANHGLRDLQNLECDCYHSVIFKHLATRVCKGINHDFIVTSDTLTCSCYSDVIYPSCIVLNLNFGLRYDVVATGCS